MTSFLLRFIVVLGILVPILSFSAKKPPSEISIGFIPGDDPVKLKKGATELGEWLQERLQVSVKIVIAKNYQGMIDLMKQKTVDFAFFTPMSFVIAEKEANAKVLLKKVWKDPFYYSTLLVKKSSDIKSLKDLKNKKIGFVDRKSTSGFLYPVMMLKKKGLDYKTYFSKASFLGNHKFAVESLFKGTVDVVAVFSDDDIPRDHAAKVYFPRKSKQVRSVWVSESIPTDPFCVREDFYEKHPQFTHNLMFAFIDFKDHPKKGNLWKKLFDISEMKMATSRQYESVRKIVREMKLGPDL